LAVYLQEEAMGEFTPIIGIGLVLLLVYLVLSVFRVINEYERLVILQLGKFKGVRGPGFIIVIPILEKAIKVDLREKFLDIPAQTGITKDNASISIDFLVYYRITDPSRAVLKVEDVERASANIATTTLRAVIGDIELDDVLSKREQINDVLRVKLDEATERWGLKVTSVEIREIEPPRDILDAMNRQMSAERDRRANVTRAEGEREAAIARAEGEKRASILEAEGQREADIATAEGARQAQLLRAEGYAAALKAIMAEAQNIDERTMALQYMNMLEEVGKSASTKFVLPMELTSMVQSFINTAGLAAGAQMNGNGSRQPSQQPEVKELER
jgi:regulator of protease activity HflC (stomatin/prohibitin superfamily)